MAVVFISPQKRQRRFFMAAITIFMFVLAGLAVLILLSQPKTPSLAQVVFNKPKVNLNTDIFKSEQFKGLQLFAELKMEFAYTALTSENKSVSGIIFAVSEEDAIKILENGGMTVLEIEQYIRGRDNPFEPPAGIQNNSK